MLKFIFKVILFFVITINLNSFGYQKFTKSGFALGADLTIIIFHNDKKMANKLLDECFKIANDLEGKVSSRMEGSIISELNKKKSLVIDDSFTLEMINDSIYYSKLTDGAFEPTLCDLIDLWGIERGLKVIPKKEAITKVLKGVGYKNILVDNNKVGLLNGASLDFGGIAAGKVIDVLSTHLSNNGVKDYLINSSGDIIIRGKFQGLRKWLIGISSPYDPSKLIGEIALTDCSITTSGDYQKFFIGDDGVRYHHIFDPKSGYPSNNKLHSFTIISDTSVKCDALSTAIFVMGVDKGLKLLETLPNTDGIFISNDENNSTIQCSSGIDKKIDGDGMWDFTLKRF